MAAACPHCAGNVTRPHEPKDCPFAGVEPEPSNVPDAQPSRDPWAHRSLGMRCHTCMWWAEKPAPEPGLHALGRCRRHAPTMNGFPAVYDDDWCGDHKLTESIR